MERDYDRIGRFIYGFQRHADPDLLCAMAPADPLSSRGAALAARFDAVMALWKHDAEHGLPDSASDTLLGDILAEAQAFAQDAGWRYGGPSPA